MVHIPSHQLDPSLPKARKYEVLVAELKSLMQGEDDLIANMANISAGLKELFQFHWVGFYLVKGQELVLGPFQGPIACTRIAKGRGVCGSAWAKQQTLIVPDVDKFPGHIACSSLSRSEIVVPIMDASQKVIGVLDIDSEQLDNFSHVDQRYLEEIVSLIPLNKT